MLGDTTLWDVSKPSSARCYDYLLGGKDHFECDREVVDMLLQVAPDAVQTAKANRDFGCRAGRFLVEQGIRQFIDLGSGIPTGDCLVSDHLPDARVVYVDNDPTVVSHSNALRATRGGLTSVLADVREPDSVLSHPKVQETIDLTQPVALTCFAVLDCVDNADDPWGVIAKLRDAVAPGSFLAMSHLSGRTATDALRQAELIRRRLGTKPIVFRHDQDLLAMFDGFEFADPGLVDVDRWRPEETRPETKIRLVGGVARKP